MKHKKIKKILVAVFLTASLLVTPVAHAQSASYQQKISALNAYFNYTEVNADGSFFISNKGLVHGVNYFGQYRFAQNLSGAVYISPDITIYGGSLYYHSLGSGDHSDSTHLLAEARTLVGYEFNLATLHRINFFAGAGYRFTGNFDAGKLTTTNAVAYDRINHLGYVPLGIGYSYGNANDNANDNDNSGFSFAIRGEYDLFLGGRQLTYFQPTKAMIYDHTLVGTIGSLSTTPFINQQNAGYGIKGSLTFSYRRLVVQPFFNYWNIETSSAAYYSLPCFDDKTKKDEPCTGLGYPNSTLSVQFTEPANSTIEVGALIGYSF